MGAIPGSIVLMGVTPSSTSPLRSLHHRVINKEALALAACKVLCDKSGNAGATKQYFIPDLPSRNAQQDAQQDGGRESSLLTFKRLSVVWCQNQLEGSPAVPREIEAPGEEAHGQKRGRAVMAQHHGRPFQEEGERQPDLALKRALGSEAETGQVRHQVWRRELGRPCRSDGGGAAPHRRSIPE